MLIASILINLFGVIVFLFIFWRRLREDYSSDIIFKIGFNILIGILLGFIASQIFLPQAFFWFEVVGGILGLILSIFLIKVRFYETFEAMVIGIFPWMGFGYLLDSVAHKSLPSFIAFITLLVLVFVSYYLDTHYKNFTWYKSGKIGFAGIVTLCIFFITRSAIAIAGISMISFVSLKIESIVSGAAAFLCFILLFNLARIKE